LLAAGFVGKFHNLSTDSIDFFHLRHNTGPVLEVLTKEFSLVADRSSLGGGERDNVMEKLLPLDDIMLWILRLYH
jgi:hypothetical protein